MLESTCSRVLALMGGVCRSSILERADSVALLQHHSRIIEQKYSHSIMDTRSMSSYARSEKKHNRKVNSPDHPRLGDGDLLGGLLSRGAGVGDRKDPVLHRRLDLLGLTTKS